MTRKVTVIGDAGVTAGMCQHANVVRWPSPDAGGADVVVVTDGERLAEVAEFITTRAPSAVVVTTEAAWCEELLERTRFPRGRVLCAVDVAAVIDAVLGAAGSEHEVTLRHDGEHGRDGFHPVIACIGAGGVLRI